ncbi:MAG TPA: MFS transporter [Aeromicrobium sp.]|nr:MFS transporter [Aeromicrobium sp.]
MVVAPATAPSGAPSLGRTVGVLSIAQVVGGLGNGAGLTVGALLVKDISGSSAWAGMATVMLTLGAAAVTVPLASYAANHGRRPALTLGWLGGTIGAATCVAAAVADSLPLVLLGLVLFGSATAANLQSRFAAADVATPAQVGRALSVVVWSTTLGAVIGPNLTDPGAAVARAVGVPDLAGPMLFAAVGFGVAGALMFALLRPDPLAGSLGGERKRGGIRQALPHVTGPAALAIYSIATAHAVMVAVMSLTPVHLQDHGAALRIIGLTISLHIAGMFALSPVMGWLADRAGSRATIVIGQLLLIAAVFIGGTAGDHAHGQVMVGLTLLGIGWSASVIAGAALLTRSIDPAVRTLVQGVSDMAMSLAGAFGGLLAGLVIAWFGYAVLNAAAGALAVPVIILILLGRTKAPAAAF